MANGDNQPPLDLREGGMRVENVLFTSVKLGACLASMAFSASLVYLTCRTKSLRETYNWLIGANAVACVGYMCTLVPEWTVAVSGLDRIPVRLCFPLMVVPIFCANCQYLLYLALALDRLLTALLPMWHYAHIHNRPRFYLTLVFSLIGGYSLAMTLTGVPYSQWDHPDDLTPCTTPDPVPQFVFHVPILFNMLSLFCYVLLWVVIRHRSATGNASNNTSNSLTATRRMLKSISVAFLLEFVGWFANTMARCLLDGLGASEAQKWFGMNVAGVLLMPTLGLYAPVLYTMSSEYRKAFQQLYGFQFPFWWKKHNAVGHLSSVAAVANPAHAKWEQRLGGQ